MKRASRYRARREAPGPLSDAELEGALAALVDAQRDAWPGVGVESEAMEAAFIDALASIPVGIDLDEARSRELYLGVACALGDRVANQLFDALFLSNVPAALARMKLDAATVDEVRQEVGRKLLVAEGDEPPKILGYAGRGSMAGLVKVTAVRTALSMLRKSGREVVEPRLADELPDATRDPELSFLAERYRAVFAEVFEVAVRALSPRERNLLRLHFLGKVTLEKLATMYGVHRATIVRHLAGVRQTLERETAKGMQARLGIAGDELQSVMNLIRSRLDVSVERMLRTTES